MDKIYIASDSIESAVKGIEKRLDRIMPYCQKSENFDQHLSIIKLYLSSIRFTNTYLKKEGM